MKVQPLLPITTRQQQEPDENDKLSPAELESLIDELVKSYDDPEIVNDPFMSPLLAPAELLKGLPPIHLIVSTCLYTWNTEYCKPV